jgi:hypothetical protein
MKLAKLSDFTNGWFIGNFEPSLIKTPAFEVAIHHYHKDYIGQSHFHRLAGEANVVISGRLSANGVELGPGDIFYFHPEEISSVKFLADTTLVIIKIPSIPGDKYEAL